MKKKKLTLAFATLACLGLLAACGGSKDSGSDDKGSDKADGVTLWTPFTMPSQTVSSWRESPFHKGLAEASGIDVEWEFPSEGTDSVQAFNLMMSEKTLPDIICYGVRNDAQSYIDDDVIYDLTDMLKEKAPNYWKFLQENPDFDKAMKTDKGRYYGFGFFRDPRQPATFIGPMIRKDWLDDNNLPVPTNIAQWETTFKTFKEKYGANMAWVYDKMDPGFAGAFGAYGTAIPTFYLDDNKKVQYAQAQPEWKDYMAWMHKMYEKGYIDPDIVTLDDEGLKTKVANDKVGVSNSYASQVTVFNDNAKASNSDAEWVPTIYPDQANGKPSAAIFDDGSVQFPTYVITKSCKGKDLDEAFKWLDFAFTEEGSNYWNFGKEGDTWEMVDGVPKFTDKVFDNELGIFEAKTLYTGNRGTGLGLQKVEATAVNKTDDPLTSSVSVTWYNKNDEAREHRLNVPLTFTSEEGKQVATIKDTLDSYVKENTYDFITGDRSLDTFDDFVSEMNDLGLKDLQKINQDAYDRYVNR